MLFARILRLPINAGLSAVVMEARRRDLSASVTVNAACINEKLSRNVFGEPFSNLRHMQSDFTTVRIAEFPCVIQIRNQNTL
jgi:hypothetical protein